MIGKIRFFFFFFNNIYEIKVTVNIYVYYNRIQNKMNESCWLCVRAPANYGLS